MRDGLLGTIALIGIVVGFVLWCVGIDAPWIH